MSKRYNFKSDHIVITDEKTFHNSDYLQEFIFSPKDLKTQTKLHELHINFDDQNANEDCVSEEDFNEGNISEDLTTSSTSPNEKSDNVGRSGEIFEMEDF